MANAHCTEEPAEDGDGFRHLTLSEMEFADRVFLQLVIAPTEEDVPRLDNEVMWEQAVDAALQRTYHYSLRWENKV
jgi:hypothetical protein